MNVGHVGEERPNRILEALSPFQNSKSRSIMKCKKKKKKKYDLQNERKYLQMMQPTRD